MSRPFSNEMPSSFLSYIKRRAIDKCLTMTELSEYLAVTKTVNHFHTKMKINAVSLPQLLLITEKLGDEVIIRNKVTGITYNLSQEIKPKNINGKNKA